MIFTDYESLKDVTFKVPELFTDKSKEEVMALFSEIKELKSNIYDLRTKANLLEETLKEKEKKWELLLPLIDLEFNTVEKEEVKGEINVGFNFGTEVNKHIH